MSTSAAPDGDLRLSGDSHVTEPPDLWLKRLPAKFADRAPTFPKVQYGKSMQHLRSGGWDPKERLKDMALDGISAEVLYPTLGKVVFEQFYNAPLDLEFSKASERAYNDWMIEYCQESPQRLWGQAVIGLWDIDYAIAEMERTKNEGLKGVATWIAPPDGLPWTGEHYERFWSAAEDLEVPIGFHINMGFGAYVKREHEDSFANTARQAYGHKVVAMQAMAEMILTGVFARHPRLTVVLAEFECGWIPFFLEDLDRKFGRNTIGLELLPSEYFSRQVYSTFMQDGVAGYLLGRWGGDNFIYSVDYPHPGGIWPHTDDTVALTLSDVPAETRRKVLGENLARAYHQPLPEPVERKNETDYTDTLWSRPWLKRAGEFTFEKSKMGLAV